MMRQYRIYGKPEGAKRFKPLGGDRLQSNIMHAEVFTIDENKIGALSGLQREVDYIKATNGGEWELRRI